MIDDMIDDWTPHTMIDDMIDDVVDDMIEDWTPHTMINDVIEDWTPPPHSHAYSCQWLNPSEIGSQCWVCPIDSLAILSKLYI